MDTEPRPKPPAEEAAASTEVAAAEPKETREMILARIDELEYSIEAQEQRIERAEARRAALLQKAEQARPPSLPLPRRRSFRLDPRMYPSRIPPGSLLMS